MQVVSGAVCLHGRLQTARAVLRQEPQILSTPNKKSAPYAFLLAFLIGGVPILIWSDELLVNQGRSNQGLILGTKKPSPDLLSYFSGL